MGGAVLHAPARPSRCRRNPSRDPHAAVRDPAVAAVARGQARRQSLRLLQPVQPGQALADPELRQARRPRSRASAGRGERRRHQQFRLWRDGKNGARLRGIAQDQTGPHHDLALRLWRHGAVSRIRRLRTGAGAALRAVVANRLQRMAADARWLQLRRSQRRRARRVCDPGRALSSQENRRRPVHRYEPVGVRDGIAARRNHGVHDERARAGAANAGKSRSADDPRRLTAFSRPRIDSRTPAS